MSLFLQLRQRLSLFNELVAFEHSVFALPFALSGSLLAAAPALGPNWLALAWVVGCMVSGRTFAMGLNRILDARIDAQNPRTAGRPIPSGRVSSAAAWAITLTAGLALYACTAQLPPLCLQLLPVVYVVLGVYSLTKRFTSLCHLVLGLALGISAIGGWMAVTGSWNQGLPVLFGLAILCWVAGFDIIYACQDEAFDRDHGLHSLPAWLGAQTALSLSKGLHSLCLLVLLGFGVMYQRIWQPVTPTHWGYWLGCGIMAALLYRQHTLVSATNLSRVNVAFFTTNGWASVLFLASLLLERALEGV
ncbi:MAG: UbiA-like polyprenyltransferase [Vampirovibrionales bacterium]|nr:UbiA-like polyprenyltransferase [Vampirovibrionales bacterium]